MSLAASLCAMEIRFVSTLTPEDEERLAPALMTAVTALLDNSELAYTLRIKTSSDAVFDHSHPSVAAAEGQSPREVAERPFLRLSAIG